MTSSNVKYRSELVNCPCCGKPYLEDNQSIYKLVIQHKTKRFCSYTCYRKLQKLLEAKHYEEIRKVLEEGRKLAEDHKIDPSKRLY